MMTTRQAFMIGCRILAIFVALNALLAIPSTYVTASVLDGSQTTAYIVIGFLICLAVVIIRLLWYKSDWIVGRIFGYDKLLPETEEMSDAMEATPSEPQVSIVNIQAILLSLLGVYVLVSTIPEVVSVLYSLLFQSRDTGLFSTDDLFAGSSFTVDIAALIARLAIGLWLVFGSPAIVDKLSRMRSSALQEAP